MKYIWTGTLLGLLFFPCGSTIDPHSQTCQDFLVSGLSKWIPGIDLVTPLQQCLVDAQHDPALETCVKNCKCTQPPGSLACAAYLDACGLNCALFNEPASCFNFFGTVISDIISDLSKLNDAYQYISQFLQCLFSVPQSQSTIVPPPMQTSQAPPLMNGNCPTTIANKGPAACGSIPGVQNVVDCQLQAYVWVAYRGTMAQIPCASLQADLCGQTTFPAAAYWCNYCKGTLGGSISGSCFNTWFDVANQPLCASFATCPQASFGR